MNFKERKEAIEKKLYGKKEIAPVVEVKEEVIEPEIISNDDEEDVIVEKKEKKKGNK